MLILSLATGDEEGFWGNRMLLNTSYVDMKKMSNPFMSASSGPTQDDILARVMMLVHGLSLFSTFEGITDLKYQYDKVFKNWYEPKWRTIASYHTFASIDRDELLDMISNFDKSKSKLKLDVIRRKTFFDPLVSFSLDMDLESVNFLTAMIRWSYGDQDGFDYIAKEYNLSISSSNAWKAIISSQSLPLKILLNTSSIKSNYCEAIIDVLDGDISALSDIIVIDPIINESWSKELRERLCHINELTQNYTFTDPEGLISLFT